MLFTFFLNLTFTLSICLILNSLLQLTLALTLLFALGCIACVIATFTKMSTRSGVSFWISDILMFFFIKSNGTRQFKIVFFLLPLGQLFRDFCCFLVFVYTFSCNSLWVYYSLWCLRPFFTPTFAQAKNGYYMVGPLVVLTAYFPLINIY